MGIVFLDTETTGLSAAAGDRIVEVAMVDRHGQTLLDTLVNPERSIPLAALQVHGITNEMVANAPTLKELWPELQGILLDNHVVIYNASFDIQFFPANLRCAAKISCAMLRFAKSYGEHQPHYGGYKWHRLEVAARHVGHKWTGDPHRALADALACRSVWMWLEKR
jgi:DNA polymerase III subunit epsilon